MPYSDPQKFKAYQQRYFREHREKLLVIKKRYNRKNRLALKLCRALGIGVKEAREQVKEERS